MKRDLWRIEEGDSPLVATAIHNGHLVRDDVNENLTISASDRFREEDPFTGIWTEVSDTRVIARFSRFQVDLNRPREGSVYIRPEDAWGLQVWNAEPGKELVSRSLQEYDDFYAMMEVVLTNLANRFGKVVVLDLHTYNHRREGPDASPADPESNPEINVGTGSMDRKRWSPVVDRFIDDLRGFDFLGRRLDVRENVRFRGGHFSRWVHQNFSESVCVLAIEVKKFFMDEWTGKKDQTVFNAVHKALESTVPGIFEELKKIGVNK